MLVVGTIEKVPSMLWTTWSEGGLYAQDTKPIMVDAKETGASVDCVEIVTPIVWQVETLI
jgi:hypothetical protein